MSPIVNTDVKMSKKMLEALTLHETFCIASGIKEVTEDQVKSFLEKHSNLSKQFDPSFLFSNPTT